MCEVVSKNIAFPKKNTNCFPTCALFHPIVLKRKTITAWHTPVRTCVRLKSKIRRLEKAKKLKKCNKNLRQAGVGVKL